MSPFWPLEFLRWIPNFFGKYVHPCFTLSPLWRAIQMHFLTNIKTYSGFGGIGVACWPLVPEFAGSNPAEAVGFLGWKNPQHAFLRRGREVKPSVPCRRFSACKRSLNLRGSRNLGKITGQISRPQFHLSLLGSLASLRTYRHLAAKVGTSKGGEAMENYPQELAQDAVCQSHTGHMTGLWFLPTRPLRLNTNEWMIYGLSSATDRVL